MSRYDWPRGPRRSRDAVGRRRAWNAARDGTVDAEQIDAARQMTRLHEADPGPLRAAPVGAAELWLPIGPTTTVRGQVEDEPRVAGRIRDFQVSTDGRRVYAASAIGGLWYSEDAGAGWEPVGAFAATRDRGTITPASNTLACGAVYVRFAPAGTPDPHAVDEVWLGTGEPDPLQHPADLGNVGTYGGVGILHAVGPVAATRAGNPDPWTRQAQPRAGYAGLRGAGVFSLTPDPADARRLIAATTRGLHVHDPAAGGPDPWSLVSDPTWDTAPGTPGSAALVVTDAVWVAGAGASPARLWVAIRQEGTPLTGLWRSDAGAAGPFVDVVLPDARTGAGEPRVLRLGLAAAPSDRDVLYVFGSGPRLWRVDGAGTVRRVGRRLPREIFGDDDSSYYNLAIAVDPANPARILIGGQGVASPDQGLYSAALYRITLQGALPAAGAFWATDYVGGNILDATWVGEGAHADVHRIRWVAGPAVPPVFVGTDGGPFLSTRSADRGTFGSRTTGMAVSEPGYIASHPDTDGVALIGCQDNGAQLRLGGTWRHLPFTADAGGVAFDPGTRGRLVAQVYNSTWNDQAGNYISPTERFDQTDAAFITEDSDSRFYSNAAAHRRADGVTQLAIGTRRVWYTERWGASRWDGVAGVWRREWMTIPSRTDPRSGNAQDTRTDRLAPGPFPPGAYDNSPGIRALRWGGDHRLYALLPGAVYRFDRDPATMAWSRPVTQIALRPAMPAVPPPPAAVAGPSLPPDGTLNDLAVHDVTAGPHGSFYLATSHPTEPVWWFDGTGTWHPCGLGVLPPPGGAPPGTPDGVRAPAYAVVVDPDHPEIVYAGTAVGVWRGVLTPAAGAVPPSWLWRPFVNGLPEAAVQDLTIDRWPDPGGGQRRLMRAALQARGAWEVDLDVPTAAVTYLRTHHYDTARLKPVPMTDPMFLAARPDRDWTLDWALARNRDHRDAAAQPANHPDGTPPDELLWHASPDIRLRPAPGTPFLAPASLDWNEFSPPADRFELWALQTAMHAIDDRVVPNGRWNLQFRRRLRELRAANGLLPDRPRVDAALWNLLAVQAGLWADPWAAGGPTEADLLERIVGMATPRAGGVTTGAESAASVALPAGAARVDVAVHRRALVEAPASDVSVLLLRLPLPTGVAPNPGPPDWAATPDPALPGVEAAMEAVGPGGGPLPAAVALPAGWDAPDTTTQIRRPSRPVRTADAAVLTFEVNFAVGTWLLLAIVHHGPGTPDLTGAADLRALVLGSPHVAARSVQVV